MEWISAKHLKKFRDFASLPGKKVLFYHGDADGICSAVCFLKYFQGYEAMPRKGPYIDDKMVKGMIKKKPSVVAFFDMAMDHQAEKLGAMAKELEGTKFIILDHHIPEKYMNAPRFLHLNPRFKSGAYLPTSFLIYDLLEKLGKKPEEHIWIAAMGVIGDFGYADCAGFLEKAREAYPKLISRGHKDSPIEEGVKMIASTITLCGLEGASEILNILMKSKKYADFAKTPRILKYHENIQRKIDLLMERFENEKEEYPNKRLVFYFMNTKLRLSSIISNIISINDPRKVVIVSHMSEDGYKISLRCQDGHVNVAKLAKEASKGIGEGGGHETAAGALVTDIKKFRERILEMV